ncbi:LysR family transcriptional regulator [Thiopseudomonas denitrificans]|uniref:DNA-binding transcriptional LysR family regulator n=1 Tax=Thiopseudomonas denitrificans TaxID=1501432 RepID=A0A4R6U192_9GAMM|nr:LysR family transcriptional regulator [Thiopseudomonas denitrificans]TDQ38169.1 DNA-binding transcriptional LysR family regulator [Thiopseudomonas denitrificans]
MRKVNVLNQVTDFDLRLLRIFKVVVESGGFSAAESTLGITKSAISQHMSDLEKRLGLRLCQRGRAGFSLTDEGAEVLQATNSLLLSIEDFRSEINQLNKQLKGVLNIGMVNNLVTQPQMLISQALSRLQEKSDGVKIDISMSTPSEITKGLFDGRLHVGVIPWTTSLSGLEYRLLYEERFNLYCSHDHPLAQHKGPIDRGMILEANAVVPNYPMTEQAVAMHKFLNCTATASDREGIAFLIMTGAYIGFLPTHYAANWLSKGEMQELDVGSQYFNTRLALVTRQGRRPNSVLESFLNFVDI